MPQPQRTGSTTGSWTLELPFQRPLSLNDRAHWSSRAADVRLWRSATTVLARAARIPPCRAVTIQLMYTPADARRRDPLNLVASLKPCEDGLVDAGVIPDDSGDYHVSVMPQITQRGPLRKNRNRLWLVITAH